MSEPYVPDLGFVYPDEPDGRMVPIKPVYEINIDKNYPYLDKSLNFRIKRFLTYFTIFCIVYFVSPIRFGLKIEGRKNLRKYKKYFKNGAMTISNHVHRWDYLFISQAVRYRTMYFPVWKEILRGPDANLIRYAGGIPIPNDIQSIKSFNLAFDEIHKKKKWIHAYPESSRFDYYQPIRPFKKGVFTIAHRYNLPVIPIAISYRKPRFPYTILNYFRIKSGGKNIPMITLKIGEPVFFDNNLDRKAAVIKIRKECHEAVVRLAGITNNPYPAEGD